MKIGSAILAVLVSSFIGIMANPEMMSASDSVRLTGISNVGVTETIISPELKTEFQMLPEAPVVVEPIFDLLSNAAPDASATKNVGAADEASPTIAIASNDDVSTNESTMGRDEIRLFGNNVDLIKTDRTNQEAGKGLGNREATVGWYHDSGQFIYAHNYMHVFGVLGARYDAGALVGERIAITMDGETRDYKVTGAKVYTYNETSQKMLWLVNGGGHDIAIMTCYGDGSRLVVFVDQI